jgi:hypothetical protein
MKRIIMLFVLVWGIMSVGSLKAQTFDESVRMLNDSTVLFERKSTDVIVNANTKRTNRSYKLKIPDIVDFGVKSLTKEDDIFLWVKIVSVKKACKGYEYLRDSLGNSSNIVLRLEQYDVCPKDSIP